jgi:hypothetical protein
MTPRHGEIWLVDMGMAGKGSTLFLASAEDMLLRLVGMSIQVRKTIPRTNALEWTPGSRCWE